jgi:hypothetical protein
MFGFYGAGVRLVRKENSHGSLVIGRLKPPPDELGEGGVLVVKLLAQRLKSPSASGVTIDY